MVRKFIDCRKFPSETACTVEIAADTDDEVLDLAVTHAVLTHKEKDTPQLRQEIRGAIETREEAFAR